MSAKPPAMVGEGSARLERLLSGLLTVAALVLAVAATIRLTSPAAASAPSSLLPEPAWPLVESAATAYIGNGAPFDLVVAVDFECAACGQFLRETVPMLQQTSPVPLSIGVLHYPLPNHPNAVQTAVAFECASEQGVARQFAEQVTSRPQTSIAGDELASASQVGRLDVSAFSSCLQGAEARERVARASHLADSLRLGFTPTVFVRGKRFDRPVAAHVVQQALSRLR